MENGSQVDRTQNPIRVRVKGVNDFNIYQYFEIWPKWAMLPLATKILAVVRTIAGDVSHSML